MRSPIGRSSFALRAAAVLAATLLSACGILDGGDTPRNARLIIEGGGGETFQLVTSNDFTILSSDDGETREIYLNSSNEDSVSAPFDQHFSLGPDVRFFFQASSEVALPQPIHVRVLIEGDERFDSTSDLGASPMEFVYSFR